MPENDLICCVVNSGQGSKVLKIARKAGLRGGTIFIGYGTVRNKLLELLDLDDVRKEIVLMAAGREASKAAAEAIAKGMAFRKPNHGIAFTLPLSNLIGSLGNEYDKDSEDKVVTDTVYNAIFTVVDRGRGQDAVDAAKAAGARGATIIHARGSGIHETGMLFAMQIEPEKDLVMILAKDDIHEDIIASIRERLHIDEPGKGIIFTVGVSEAYGLY